MDFQTQLLADLDNALIHQKDALIALIDSDDDAKVLKALTILECNLELWAACRYAYKGVELTKRIRDKYNEQLMDTTHHITTRRLRTNISDCDKLMSAYHELDSKYRRAA